MASSPLLRRWVDRLNRRSAAGEPSFFLLDFELREPRIWSPRAAQESGLRFCFPGRPDRTEAPVGRPVALAARPIPPQVYARAFDAVQRGLRRGDSFLTNLTFATPIVLEGRLADVYAQSLAKYRVLLPDRFVSFSPETFVTIDSAGYLETRPMKGTAPNTPAGRRALAESTKEIAEHATIVDLMRNDLSRVAKQVSVTDYRYLRAIDRGPDALLQSSSKIGGRLPDDWKDRLGDILLSLLPAGSVSGAPKLATLELIRRAEAGLRGYYCGVAGYFDGRQLDSCVLIRFIEQSGDRYFFRSGGGITALSVMSEEYAELNAKIRIPSN